jgi:hypothetical protein
MSTMNIFDLTDTWNAGGTTFVGIKLNATDTASAAASLLMDLQVGGVSRFSVRKDGVATAAASFETPNFGINNSAGAFYWKNDLFLLRDAADTLAQRRSTNPQAFRVYNTFTDASNYERFSVGFNGGTVQVRQEHAGSGSVRAIYFGNADLGNVFGLAPAGGLLWVTDNTYDIGASGATRPRDLHLGGTIYLNNSGIQGLGILQFNTGSKIRSASDGVVQIGNNANTDFGRLQLGGATNSFPAVKRDGAGVSIVGGADGSTAHIKVPGVTVANLPAAATAGAGARSFVTDALAPVFGSAVAGSGAVNVPVYSDGSTWNVG